MLMPVLGMFFLLLAIVLQYTPVFLIDFTETPETVQIFASWLFFMLFAASMLYTGWRFYDG